MECIIQRPKENMEALSKILVPFTILAFDESAADEYGKIKTDLSRRGQIIGPNDMLIAAHALDQSCVLVTNNEREIFANRSSKD